MTWKFLQAWNSDWSQQSNLIGRKNAISTASKAMQRSISPTVTPAASTPEKARAFSRRWLMRQAGYSPLPRYCFLFVFPRHKQHRRYSKQTVLNEAIGFSKPIFPCRSRQCPIERPPPSQYFPSARHLLLPRNSLASSETFSGAIRRGLRFTRPRRRGRATLYVVDRKLADLGMPCADSNPSTPEDVAVAGMARKRTGLCAGWCKVKPKSYQEYLNLPRGPIA